MSRELDALVRLGTAAKDLIEAIAKPEPTTKGDDVWSAATRETCYPVPKAALDDLLETFDSVRTGTRTLPPDLVVRISALRKYRQSG